MNFSNGTRAALLLCLSLLLAACGLNNKSPAAGVNPREELAKAMSAHINTKSFRAKMSVTSSVGMRTTMELDFVAPDRFRAVMESNISGRGSAKRELLILGKETYMRGEGGSWEKVPTDMSAQISQFRDPRMVERVTKDAEVKFVGDESVAGTPAHVYQHTFTDAAQMGSKAVTKTWVGVADGLPIKTESDAEMNFQGKAMSIKTTTTYSDYNADIKIDSPM